MAPSASTRPENSTAKIFELEPPGSFGRPWGPSCEIHKACLGITAQLFAVRVMRVPVDGRAPEPLAAGRSDTEFAALVARLGAALGKSRYLDGHQTDWSPVS